MRKTNIWYVLPPSNTNRFTLLVWGKYPGQNHHTLLYTTFDLKKVPLSYTFYSKWFSFMYRQCFGWYLSDFILTQFAESARRTSLDNNLRYWEIQKLFFYLNGSFLYLVFLLLNWWNPWTFYTSGMKITLSGGESPWYIVYHGDNPLGCNIEAH